MAVQEQIYAAYQAGDLADCRRILDGAAPATSRDDRRKLPYWRPVLFEHEGRFAEALQLPDDGRDDVYSKSGYALHRARLFKCLGRTAVAISTLTATPIVANM